MMPFFFFHAVLYSIFFNMTMRSGQFVFSLSHFFSLLIVK